MKLASLVIIFFMVELGYPTQIINRNAPLNQCEKKLNPYIHVYRSVNPDGSVSEEKNSRDDLLKKDLSNVSQPFLLQYMNMLKIMIDPENITYKHQYIHELPSDYESLSLIAEQDNGHLLSKISLEFPKQMIPVLVNVVASSSDIPTSGVDTTIDEILIQLIVDETDLFLHHFNQRSNKEKYNLAYFVSALHLINSPQNQNMLVMIKNSGDNDAYKRFMDAQNKKDNAHR